MATASDIEMKQANAGQQDKSAAQEETKVEMLDSANVVLKEKQPEQ